jgi:hypothetical protein
MNLSLKEVAYEQFVLGCKAMFKGLAQDRDPAWIYLPFFIGIRGVIYTYMMAKSRIGGHE